MNRAVQIAKILVLLTLAGALFALTIVVLQLREDIDVLTNNGIGIAEHFEHLEGDLDDRVKELKVPLDHADQVLLHAMPVEDAALARVKDLQPVEQKAGSVEDAALARVNEFKAPIAEVHSLLYDSRATVSEMNRTTLAERKYFEVEIPATTERLNAAIDGILPVEKNMAAATGSGAVIIEDGRKIADKETSEFLKPVPWYMQPVKRFGDLWDMAAAVARHAP